MAQVFQSVFLIEPLTDKTHQWLQENADSAPWQWLGKNLAVEHRYVADLVAGMFEAGFMPHRDFRVS